MLALEPDDFRPLKPLDAVMAALGPFFIREETDHIALGFRVEPRHCNPRGACHGGVLATFVDLQLGMNVSQITGRGGPTITLTLDYLAPGKVGQWIEGRTQFLRSTPNMAFVQCLVTADGAPAVRGNAIFRNKLRRLTLETAEA